jgi:hypothetical protein
VAQFPRSRIEPRTDGRRPPSGSFGAAAPSGSVVAPAVVGIDHSRLPAFTGRFPTRLQTPTGVTVAFASFAVEKPRFRRSCLTISVLSLGPAWGCATARIRPLCLPRRALPFGLLDPKARGIGFLLYDQQEVLSHRAQFAPRGARNHRRSAPVSPARHTVPSSTCPERADR